MLSPNALCTPDVVVRLKIGFRMEPALKRFKTDDDPKENGTSDKKSAISRESPHNGEKCSDKPKMEREPALHAGNEQLPVCKHGEECTQIDLIHFAEFWHPTAKSDGDEDSSEKGESCEENECEVVDLPYVDEESTQPVFDDYCDSESEDGEDEGSVTAKTHEERFSSNSLGSQ